MSIQSQALFWKSCVCDITDSSIQQSGISHELAAGMDAYSDFLRTMYADYEAFEFSTEESIQTKIGIKKDDLENYHNLTDTALCLYSIAYAGKVEQDGTNAFLLVDKAAFKQVFKKPAQKFFQLLTKYQFAFHFLKQGKPAKSYASADAFEVYYPSNPALVHAIKYLNDHLPQTDVKKDYAPATTIFLMADYDTMIMGRSTSRSGFSPVHPSILNILANQQQIWKKTVGRLCEEVGLQTDVSVNTYVFPNWIVKFIHQKRTICTFHIRNNQILLRLPLSYPVAKEVIDMRQSLPQSIQNSIQKFGCVNCGKCVDSSNLEQYAGYHLCRLSYQNFTTEDSRLIQFVLTQDNEIDAVFSIIKKLIDSGKR